MAVSCQRADYFRLWRAKIPDEGRVLESSGNRYQRADGNIDRGCCCGGGRDRDLQLFCRKLCDDKPWRRRVYSLYACIEPACITGAECEKGTDHRKGRFDGILHRVPSPLRSPGERVLCESDEICEPVGTDRQKSEPAVLNAGKYDL